MDTLLTDLRYAARMIRKSKVVTTVAVLSLALGIGANSAIFSLVNAILLRPRAVARPEQLVELYSGDRQNPYQTSSYPSYLDFRDRNEVFTGLAAYGVAWQFKLGGAAGVEQVWGEVVSGNYFDVLGVRAHAGRTFVPEEDQVPNRNPVVVIGFRFWQRRFNADPGLVGRTITINNQPLTVVGIAPPEYTGMLRGLATEVWVPAMITPLLDPRGDAPRLTSRGSKWATMIGRLKPGTTIDDVRAQFRVFSAQMQAAHPDEWRRGTSDAPRDLFVSVVPEKQTRVHPSMRGIVFALAALLFVIVDLVLLIAGINLASMLLARAVARRQEIAVRLALGAARARIIRQLLTESVVVSLIAGALGIVLAVWGMHLLVAFMPALPEGMRLAVDVQLDWRVVLYTTAVATVTGLLLGLAPALHCARTAMSTVLRDESSAVTGRHRTSRVRRSLVVAQVACSVLLLVGAGLALRSLANVQPTRLGFQSENVLVAPLTLDEADARTDGQRFYEQLAASLEALPGVQHVSLVEGVPGGFMSRSRSSTEIEGYVQRADESLEIDVSTVGPRYFTNMRVPFVQGRDFDARDREGAPCVAIINEAFARRYLAGVSPLDKHLARYDGDRSRKRMCAIVGVIRDDAWQSLQKEARPFYALPLLQSDRRRMTALIGTLGDPKPLTSAVRQTIRTLDPRIPVADVQTLGEYFSVGLYPFRLLGIVIAGCGVLALLLATIGIYGIVSFSVAQRTREVGIRMALGALRRDILELVIGQGMVLVGYGLAVGLVVSLILTTVLTSMPLDTELLYGVSATDPLTFGGVTMFLAAVALLACWVPALRAARVDPTVALRDS